jgi:hypothetical protein
MPQALTVLKVQKIQAAGKAFPMGIIQIAFSKFEQPKSTIQ